MLDAHTTQRIEAKLAELHARHRVVAEDPTTRYYEPGGGNRAEPGRGQAERFAVALATPDGTQVAAGDCEARFALQSISKLVTYGLALVDLGRAEVLRRVGVAPSGEAFNAIEFDERHQRPFNPMVNAGALVAAELVAGATPAEKLERILQAVRDFAGNPHIAVDVATHAAELAASDRNRAIAYLMHGRGMLRCAVEDALWVYLGACSIGVDTRDLAVMAGTLAGWGVNPKTGRTLLERDEARDVLSVMYTCGMYDYAGEWAFDVGVPAKSGVSGGILAVVPGKVGLAVFSPGIDAYGNSVRGVQVSEDVSARLGLHVFASEEDDVLLGPDSAKASGTREG